MYRTINLEILWLFEKPVTSRSRNRKPEGKSHDLTTKYHVSFIIFIHIAANTFLWFWMNQKKINICQTLFLTIFSVSQRRVNTVVHKIQSGRGIVEETNVLLRI
jgi:hypothetical protein